MKLLLLFYSLIVSTVIYSQGGSDVKYIFIDDYISKTIDTSQALQIDFKAEKGDLNQYLLVSWIGDTVQLYFPPDTISFTEHRKRNSDTWLFRDQFLQGVNEEDTIVIDSCKVNFITNDSISFKFYSSIFSKQSKIKSIPYSGIFEIDRLMGLYIKVRK